MAKQRRQGHEMHAAQHKHTRPAPTKPSPPALPAKHSDRPGLTVHGDAVLPLDAVVTLLLGHKHQLATVLVGVLPGLQ